MSRVIVQVPPVFYEDHVSRDLPGGVVLHRTKTYLRLSLSVPELHELYSDASHYADPTNGYSTDYPGLVASARATMRRLQEAVESSTPLMSWEQERDILEEDSEGGRVIYTTAPEAYDYSLSVEQAVTSWTDRRGDVFRRVALRGSDSYNDSQQMRYGSGLYPSYTPEEFLQELEFIRGS